LQLAQGSTVPDEQLAAFHRLLPAFARKSPSVELCGHLARLVESSNFLPRVLQARPTLLRWLTDPRCAQAEKPLGRYVHEAQAASRLSEDKDALWRRLRHYKYREILRIAWRDAVLRVPMPVLGRETSALAQALVSASLSWNERALATRFGAPEN